MREALKSVARGVALVAVLPMIASFQLRALLLGRDRALQGSTQTLSLVPGLTGEYLRRAFLSVVLAYVSPSATICFGTVFSRTGARIDDHVYIGARCHIGLVHLEPDVLVADGVYLPSGGDTHGTADVCVAIREQPRFEQLVRVGRGAWIGSGAVVLADVGAGTVVGAGAVVTRALPALVVAAGVPARPLRSRLSSVAHVSAAPAVTRESPRLIR